MHRGAPQGRLLTSNLTLQTHAERWARKSAKSHTLSLGLKWTGPDAFALKRTVKTLQLRRVTSDFGSTRTRSGLYGLGLLAEGVSAIMAHSYFGKSLRFLTLSFFGPPQRFRWYPDYTRDLVHGDVRSTTSLVHGELAFML